MKIKILAVLGLTILIFQSPALFAQSLPRLSNFPSAPSSSYKNNSNLTLRNAFSDYFDGRYSKAAEKFESYFASINNKKKTTDNKKEKEQTSAYSHSIYSMTLAKMGRFDQALQEIKKARALQPDLIDYILLQTEILEKAGKPQEALYFLEGFQYKLEDEPEIEFYLAELKFHLGQRKQAKIHYLQTLFHIHKTNRKFISYRRVSLWRTIQLIFAEKRGYQKAEKYLREYVNLVRNNGYARFMLANYIYFENGKYEQALRELETLSNYGPEYFEKANVPYPEIKKRIHSFLLQLYFFFENPDFHNVALLISKPNTIENAMIHTSQNKNQLSISLLEKALKENPQSAYILWHGISRIYKKIYSPAHNQAYSKCLKHIASFALKHKRYRDGIIALNEYHRITQQKRKEHIYLLYAAHYQLYKQHRRSAFFVKKAIREINKKMTETNLNTSEINKANNTKNNTGQNEKKNEFKKENLLIYFSYIDLLNKFDPPRALRLIDQIIKEHPKDPIIFSLRAKLHLSQSSYQQALKSFDQSIKLSKQSLKQPPKTKKDLIHLIRLERNNRENHFFRAYISAELKDYEAAKKDTDMLLQRNHNNPLVRNMKAYILATQELKLIEALNLILPVVMQHPMRANFHDTLGWVYFKLKRLPQARYHLQLAANLVKGPNPSQAKAEILEHLGDVYSSIKRFNRALASYEEAMNILSLIQEKHPKTLNKEIYAEIKQKLSNKINKAIKAQNKTKTSKL